MSYEQKKTFLSNDPMHKMLIGNRFYKTNLS